MSFGDQTQFDYLFDALAQKYPGIANADGATTLFQFMETPMGANWTNGSDADAFHLADATSVNLDGWFVQGNGFANAYQDMVLSIEPTTGADNPNYRNDVDQIAIIDKNIQNTVAKARADYQVFLANNPKASEDFSTWLADPFGGQNYQQQLDELQTQRGNYAQNQANVLAALDSALSLAQKAVNPWSETMNIAEGGASRNVPLETIGGDLQSDILRWNNRPEGEFDFDATITKDDTITYPWKTTYKTTTHADCWGASATLTVSTSRIIADEHYKLRVTAVGANSYKINRGSWYHDDLVNPNTKIVKGSAWSNDSFFGLNGSLHLVPEEIFVLYRPSIQLTISTQLYKQTFETNANADVSWINIFGLQFGVDGLASLQTEGDATKTTITFQAPKNMMPQIVGIISKVIWNNND